MLCLKYRVKRLAQASGPVPFVFLGDENQGGGGGRARETGVSGAAGDKEEGRGGGAGLHAEGGQPRIRSGETVGRQRTI